MVSAGLLLYRRRHRLEVFLAHPGGPFWADKDLGAWTIPKGSVEEGELPLYAAQREFNEETGLEAEGPYIDLGSVIQKSGKRVHAWAFEGDADVTRVCSTLMKMVWPPNSGRMITIPEIDRCSWFEPTIARRKINGAQAAFIDRLELHLKQVRSG